MSNDFDEEELLAFCDALARDIAEDESGVSVLNVDRKKELEYTYNTLKSCVKKGTKVSKKEHEPFPSMGSVSLKGKKIVVKDAPLFAKCANMAHNMDVYSQVDGTVNVDLTFHNLTIKIGDK